MSEVQEFDPRNFMAQRRARLARIAAAAVEPPWPTVEKLTIQKPAPPIVPKPVPVAPAAPIDHPPGFQPTIREIQIIVGAYYGVSTMDIRSARRLAEIIKPRQIAMYLAKRLTPRPLTEIGIHFGGRDHTTILHAVRKVTYLLTTDHVLAGEISELIRRLGGEHA